MTFGIFPFLHFSVFLVYLFLIFYVIWKNPKSSLNWAFAFLFACFAIWSFGYIFIHNLATSKETAKLFMNIAALGWIGCINALLLIALIISERKVRSWLYLFALIPTLFFLYLQWQGLLIENYYKEYYGWGFIFGFDKIYSYLWMAYYFAIIALMFYLLLSSLNYLKDKIKKKQIKVILVSSLLFALLVFLIDLFLPALNFYVFPNISNVFALIWVGGIGYAMVKYRFLALTPALAAKNILATMSDALIILDLTGNIIQANQAMVELSGYNKEELKKIDLDYIFLKNNFKEQLLSRAIKRKVFNNYDLDIRGKDGKNISVFFSSSNFINNQGELMGIIGVAKDIRKLKKTREELKEKSRELKLKIKKISASKKKIAKALEKISKEKQKVDIEQHKIYSIVSNIKDPVIFINRAGRIKIFNLAAQKILGLNSDALESKIADKNNFSLNNFKNIIKNKYRVKKIKEGKNVYSEKIFLSQGNRELVYKVITAKAVSGKNHFGYVKFFYDLTREEAINKMKIEFISIAAHQLRTPLAAIKWGIKMVLDGDAGKLNKAQKDLLDKGYKSNERVIGLVNDLLKVSRIEEKRFAYQFKTSDFSKVLGGVVDDAKEKIKEKKIKLKISRLKGLFKIFMDKDRIGLVLQNLLDNAIKYTPENGTIEIKFYKKGKFFNFIIKDNGVGIPKEDQGKIFTKFFRAKNVIRIQTEGSGLGLFIVKKIIEKHKGKIYLESKEGKGTKVSFSLPLK